MQPDLSPEDIARAWWDLCEQGRPVTARALAEALGISETVMRQRLGCLNYLRLVALDDEDKGAT